MIKLENISYNVESKLILKDISCEINFGDIVGLVGESGAGKTTISKIIANTIKATSGKILYKSINQNDIQILFQNGMELINPARKVKSIFEDVSKKNRDKIIEVIKKVNLSERVLDKYGYQLSGGERQRVALSRILITSPKLLILDEPFSAQDPYSQNELVELFTNLNEVDNVTIFCVSHDLNIMSHFPTKLGILHNGSLIEFNETNRIVKNPQEYYTSFLFEALNYNLTIDEFNKDM